MNAPGHEMILASAGSGKTYQLTNRYVRLLALGAPPERIVALTFTRKAAGEFFDEILRKLARAATEAEFAHRLAGEIEAPQFAPADFRALLRTVVEAMPRLSLSTFDAFFARIVRSFPLELGLGGDFELLQEHAAHRERQRVLQRMFARRSHEVDPAQREFGEAFKRATFGVEEKKLGRLLDDYLDSHHQTFLAAPDARWWGQAEAIWPEGNAWLGPAPAAEPAALQAWVESAELGDKQRDRWRAFLAALETWSPGSPVPRELSYVVAKVLAAWPDFERGAAVLEFDRKKQELSSPASECLQQIVRHIFSGELQRSLETTRGIFTVLQSYDRTYDEGVRRLGRLTFADVQRLLSPTRNLILTQDQESAAAQRQLLLEWRLDGRFDHWLLDEFQDTSHEQWSVLKNLIDEVVQDASAARSFFCVGDVKQAIYGWREGDARLFRKIFDHYNATGSGTIAERRLDVSWRSGPAVLTMVNRVFGHEAAIAKLFPADTAARWSREWGAHHSAHPDLTGQAAWLHADDEADCFAATLRLLRTIEPRQRGLTTAVLVRKNDTAHRLADFLRREGHLPAVAESDLHVGTDNPVAAALLALLQAAAHPGDSLAWNHVRMSPLDAVLRSEGINHPDDLTRRLLTGIHEGGFESCIEYWLQRIEPQLDAHDTFSRERGRQLAEAARRFDETASRDVAEFVQFVQRYTVRDAESPAVIRVMTIHKSKGLGFDLVVLPDLEGNRLATRRSGLAVHRANDRTPEWILKLPDKLFYEHEPTLCAHVREEEAEACYDQLALLYVALTRARRGIYAISKSASKSASHNYPKLLNATLGDESTTILVGETPMPGGYAAGDPKWFESVQAEPTPPEISSPSTDRSRPLASRRARFPARNPSELRSGTVAGSQLFSGRGPSAADFGRAVHAALAAVDWWRPTALQEWASKMRQLGLPPTAVDEAQACLNAPELVAVFARPAADHAEVWRERRFESIIDGHWVTGVFDRVVVEYNSTGTAGRVTVFDFKTDQWPAGQSDWTEVAARHRAQMELYRQAAASLAGVSHQQVICALVFTAALDDRGTRAAPVVLSVPNNP